MNLLRRVIGAVSRTEPEHIVYLGLGSNLGDRLDHLQDAVNRLNSDPRIVVQAVSSIYETEPMGGPDQGPYLNMGVRAATVHTPSALLAACNRVEAELGRERSVRWGPRTIDIDVLLYADGRIVDTSDLQVPHPRLAERAFALIPTIEVAPGQTMPDGTTLTAALARLAPVEGIIMVGSQVQEPR
jgi:2-amino-4-hydroxy-6-hydroxymethyldihydropteridine diphosphokinase